MRNTVWLKSPVNDRTDGLKIGTTVEIQPYFGRRRTLKLIRTSYRIGASSDCDIVLDDPFVSNIHAELKLDFARGVFAIRNGNSSNGLMLNSIRLEHAMLPVKGILRLGRSEIRWRETESETEDFDEMIVGDDGMRELLLRLKDVAKSNLPVLVLGETGTGKELIAKFIHKWSDRSREKLVTLNSATLGNSLAESELFGHKRGAFTGAVESRRGAITLANRGSLFLDEIGDLPAEVQVKLLRALESGEAKALGSDQTEKSDFRLISATSRSLESSGFRADLYYRIAGYIVEVPPLRNRPKDIIAIAEAAFEIDNGARQKLLAYSWPGNVRELQAVLRRAIMLARASGETAVHSHHIQFDKIRKIPIKIPDKTTSLEELEKIFILAQLERNDWSRKVTAKQLGISRSTLFKKMEKYQIAIAQPSCESKRPTPFPGEAAGLPGV